MQIKSTKNRFALPCPPSLELPHFTSFHQFHLPTRKAPVRLEGSERGGGGGGGGATPMAEMDSQVRQHENIDAPREPRGF